MILIKARPTPAQAEAGNYKMKRRSFRGLQISIENPAGSVREGTDRTGKSWRTKMVNDYGYIRLTEGVDGDHVDCYIGPDEDAPNVYVVHQRKAGDWKEFDEDKAMLGFPNKSAAVRAYLAHYDNPRFLGPVTTMPFDEFKAKVLATKGDPGMIKARVLFAKSPAGVLFLKSYVRAHTRRGKNGKLISVGSYHTDVVAAPAPVRRGNDTKTGDLFGGDKPVDRSRAAERGLTADNDMRSAKQKAYEAEHGPEEQAYSRRLPNGKWMPGDKDGPIAGAPEFEEMIDAYHFARRALEARGRSQGGDLAAPERVVRVPAGTTAVGHVEAFDAARREAGKMARDAVVRVRIEREPIYSNMPAAIEHGAFVSNGDGDAIYVSADFPESRKRPSDAEIKNMVAAYREKAAGQDAKVSAVKAKRLADIKAKGIVVGAQWKGAQAYVVGHKGLATFSNARVVSIGQDGIITVQASMRGSPREWVLKVEPDSRLFDSYPGRKQD